MKKCIRIIAVLMTVILLCACNTSFPGTETEKIRYSSTEGVYRYHDVAIPDEYADTVANFYVYDGILYIQDKVMRDAFFSEEDMTQVVNAQSVDFLAFDTEGNLMETIHCTAPIVYGVLQTPYYYPDAGVFYFAGVEKNPDQCIVIRTDTEGNVLNETTLTASLFGRLCVLEQSYVYIDGYKTCVFDKETLEVTQEISSSVNLGIGIYGGGIYTVGDTVYAKNNNILYLLDLTAGVWKEVYPRENSSSGLGLSYIPALAGENYPVYYVMEDGIYGSDGTNDTMILNWINSGLDKNTISVEQVLSGDCFIVLDGNSLTDRISFAILKPADTETIQPKEILSLAVVDGTKLDTVLTNAVAKFNRNNTMYQIEIVDYYKAPAVNTQRTMEDFQNDLIMGFDADMLYVYGNFVDMHAYAQNGMFADLTPYTADDLLGCIRGSYTGADGSIYYLPAFFSANILVSPNNYTNGSSALPLDTVYELADSLEDGEYLFGAPYEKTDVMDQLILQSVQGDFINLSDKTCSFDSAEYVKFLNFYKDMKKYSTKNVSSLYEKGDLFGSSYRIEGERLLGNLIDGNLKFMNIRVREVEMFFALRKFFSDTTYYMYALPSSDSTAIQVNATYLFSIMKDTDTMDGCIAFMKYLHSPEFQGDNAVQGADALPVTAAGWYGRFGNASRYDLATIGENDMQFITRESESENAQLTLTESEIDTIINFFKNAEVNSIPNPTVNQIIEEEISAYMSGQRSAEDTAAMIQNRVFICINE